MDETEGMCSSPRGSGGVREDSDEGKHERRKRLSTPLVGGRVGWNSEARVLGRFQSLAARRALTRRVYMQVWILPAGDHPGADLIGKSPSSATPHSQVNPTPVPTAVRGHQGGALSST
jgi:hypothetical protein